MSVGGIEKGDEEGVVLAVTVIPGHRYPKTADCVEITEQLAMICIHGIWIRVNNQS